MVSGLDQADPRKVGSYRLVGRLGEGGQGVVFLGEGEAGSPRVAVKLLHARFSADSRMRERFAEEVASARKVAPFCTATVIEAALDGDAPYIVSEYVEGRSLAAVVAEEGPRTGPGLDRIAVGCATALVAIHRAGIVHRDFKPSNVLLAADGPRVIDFGIARSMDATGTATTVGTPAYMAPEQVRGDAQGAEADVFAWACTVVFAATGRPPFGSDGMHQVMQRILTAEPVLDGVPQPLRALVAECLAKDPRSRPASEQVLMRLLDGHTPEPEALLTLGAELAAPTEPESSRPPAGRRPLVRRRPVIAGAFVTVLAVAGLVAWNLVPADDESPAVGPGLRMVLQPVADNDFGPSTTSVPGQVVTKQLFTGLVETGRDGRTERRLATDIRSDPTCTNWTITIRPGTTFSNGEPVDAAAFVRSWTRAAMKPGVVTLGDIDGMAGLQANKTSVLRGLTPQGHTLGVKLIRPDCEFEKRLGLPHFAPVPLAAGPFDNEAYNAKPIGNGPYKLTGYQAGKQIVLERNDKWAFGKPGYARVTIALDEDYSLRGLTGLKDGTLDLANLTSKDLVAAKDRFGPGAVQAYGVPGGGFIVPIIDRGPMASREARLAVSYAIDRQNLADSVFGGVHQPSATLVPATLPGFNRTGICDSCEHPDADRARTLARQAGLPSGKTVRIVVKDEVYTRVSKNIETQLEQVLGWQVEIIEKDNFADFHQELTSEDRSGLAIYGWFADHPSAYSYLHQLLGRSQIAARLGTGFNYSGWGNRTFDTLLSSTLREPQEANRQASFHKAEKLALDDMALIPLWNFTTTYLTGPKVTSLRHDFYGDPLLATATAP